MHRKMGNLEVYQRIKDGYFNATSLLKQWNKISEMKKELKDYFLNKSTDELIQIIIDEENLHTGNSPYVKSRASRGGNAGTWMHPILFIDFAMWLNPRFKYHVIKFVYDELIRLRHESGDMFVAMNKAITVKSMRQYGRPPDRDIFINTARHIKDVLGVENWQTATELQLEFRKRLEAVITLACRESYTPEQKKTLFDFTVKEYYLRLTNNGRLN